MGNTKNNKGPLKSPYRPDIDGLRAVAVLLVICFHAAPAFAPGGFIGVDVFFVISGYLIAGLIWTELDAGRFSLLVFYARRCRRIIPALAVVLLATWLIGWYGLFADEFENLGKHVLGGAAFVSNLVLAQEIGYFDVAAEAKPLLHLWSLGIEEQFYLLWPAVALVAFRRGYRIGLVLAALGLGSLSLYLLMWPALPALSFYLLPTRLWEILAGAGLAYYERSGPSGRHGNLKASVAVLILAVAALGLDFGLVQPRLWPVAGVLAAVLLISAGPQAAINRTVLAARPAVFLGLISYPLYLWHWPMLTLARISEGGELDVTVIVGVLAISFVLSWMTWLLVEQPLRYRVFRVETGGRPAIACLAWSGVALGLAALLGGITLARETFDGGNDTFLASEPKAAETEDQWHRTQYRDAACLRTGNFADADFCRRSEDPLVAAVIGDSHANHLMPGLVKLFSAKGTGIIHVGDGGCPSPELWLRSPQAKQACKDAGRAFVDFVSATPKINTVLLASRISLYTDAARGYGFQEGASNMAALVEGYSELIAKLEAAGKKVIVLTELPQLGFDPNDCVALRPLRISPRAIRRPCTQAPDEVQLAVVHAFIDALKSRHEGLTVFDMAALLCDQTQCTVMHEGRLLYRDRNHLSVAGSRHVASHLFAITHAADRVGFGPIVK